jgi:hypothetical protein
MVVAKAAERSNSAASAHSTFMKDKLMRESVAMSCSATRD